MESRAQGKKVRLFNSHETARAQSLEGTPLAGFGQRAMAFGIDFLVVLMFFAPIDFARQYLWMKFHHELDKPQVSIRVEFDPRHLEDLVFLIVYAALCLWLTNGQTLGKRLLRIRVVSLTRPKITLWQAVERGLGYGASLLEGGFGFIQYFIHHNRQCVHDRIAETIVVKEPRRVPAGTVFARAGEDGAD